MPQMTKQGWRAFRFWFTVASASILCGLWLVGAFEAASIGVLLIVGFTLAAVAIASYFFWRDLPENRD